MIGLAILGLPPMLTLIATAFYQTNWFEAVIIIAVTAIVARVVDFVLARRDRAVSKLLGKTPDRADRTRYIMIRRLVIAGILFLGIGIALLKIPAVESVARAMLASAAIVAGVIGIAARAPIANLVSGVMIAFSQPVRLNDYISVDGEFGTVEEISLLYTFIRSADGRRIVLPNEAFASKAVHNYSMGSTGSAVSVDLVLPLDVDVERASDAMLEVIRSLAPAGESERGSVEVAEIEAGGVRLRLHAWAVDPLTRREFASDLRAAALHRLTAEGFIGGEG